MHAPLTFFPFLLYLLAAQSPTSEPADVAAIQDSSFVNSNFEAEEALRKARDVIARADWPAAAAAMQEIANKFGGHVIRLDRGRYTGIKRFVHAEIATWPASGLAAYRAAFEKTARAEFETAKARHDIRKMLEVSETYFCTSAAAAALDCAGELALEAGDFRTAILRYRELIAHHPDKVDRSIEWQSKIAMTQAWEGDLAPLRQLLSRPSKQSTDIDRGVKWAGRDQSLREFLASRLAELEKQPSELQLREQPASTAAFCGGPNRRAAYRSTAEAEAMLWRCRMYDTSNESGDHNSSTADPTEAEMVLRSIEGGRLLTMSPVFGNGRVFISNGQSIWAIDPARPEKPIWRFDMAGLPQQPIGWISEDEPPDQHTILFADGKVLASLHREVTSSEEDAPRRVSALICLEAATGKLIWKNELKGLATRFEELSLDGAPVDHNGLLYTIVRKRKGFGFEACLLLCFNPEDGKLLWSTHVGEAATGSYGFTHPTRSLPAAVGDRVFIHTNLGTIAAVNALTGSVEWLVTYPSRYANETEAAWPTRFGQPLRTWQYQPTMAWRDSIVCAPMDLDELLILDQFDGHVVRRTPMENLFNPESILGIRGDMLYTAGAQVLCHNLATGEVTWQRPLAEGGKPFGRGAIVSNGLLVPTATALLRYPLDGGPATIHRWRIENAGNLLPIDDQIIVAGAGTVSGLIARDEAFARLETRFKQDASNAEAALAIAELAFEMGEDARGLRAVGDAVNTLKGSDAAESRKRDIFSGISRIAESLMAGASDPTQPPHPNTKSTGRIAMLIQLIELAGSIAPDDKGAAAYRLILASLQLQDDNPAEAIASYQQILSNPALRRLRLPVRRDWMPKLAGDEPTAIEQESSLHLLAEEWIDAIMDRDGRKTYRAVESEAAEQLRLARDSQGDLSLMEIANSYPNSLAADDALFLHARRMADAGDGVGAARALRHLLSRNEKSRRADAIRLLAQSLATQNNVSESRRWLERGVRDYPNLRFGDEKKSIGFADLIAGPDAMNPAMDVISAAHRWPLVQAYRNVFPQRVSLLSTSESALQSGPLDLLITYADSKIEVRNARDGRLAWPESAPCAMLPILLGSDEERILFAGAHTIFAHHRTNGEKAWQFGVDDDDDPLTDPEELETWTDHVVAHGRIISASDRGDIVCISATNGVLQWRREIEGGTASHLAADDRFVYCAKWRGRSNVIHFIDAATGEPRGELTCEDSRPIQLLYPAPDCGLLVIMAKSIMRIDPASREIVWSLATPRHFLVSTFLHDEGGFIISDDARRIFKRDDFSGRLLWRSLPIGDDDRDGLWTASADGRIIAASRDELFAFDSADGRLLWRNHDSVSMRWQAPIVTTDSIVTIAPHERPTTQPSTKPAADSSDRAVAYRITRHALADGKQLPVAGNGPLITEPLESFGGLYVRDHSLIILDGQRLIGYAAE